MRQLSMSYQAIWQRNWRRKHPEYSYQKARMCNMKLRLQVFEYLGGAVCVNCGTIDVRSLEINHKNGVPEHERKSQRYMRSGPNLHRSILDNHRKEEFDVRCRVCNAAYYLEKHFGIRYRIEPIIAKY